MASVAIRSLAHAAECLTDRREQEEVLQIFTKINKETGWRINFVFKELKEKWGWRDDPSPTQAPHQQHQQQQQPPQLNSMMSSSSMSSNLQVSPPDMQNYQYQPQMQSSMSGSYQQQQQHTSLPAPPPPPPAPSSMSSSGSAPPARPPAGIVNPMYRTADFSMPQHPYQNVYVAPNYPLASHSGPLLYY